MIPVWTALWKAERRASVHQRLIDQRLEHPAVIGTDRAWRLRHVEPRRSLPWDRPRKSAGVTSPQELAGGAGHAGNPVALAHGKAQAEGVARGPKQQLTRLERRRDARAEMIRRHQLDGGAAHHARAVELTAVEQ